MTATPGKLCFRPEEIRACERISLRDVVLQVVGAEPLTSAQIHELVLDEYGSCSRGRVDSVLRGLVREGRLRFEDGMYTRAAEAQP
jgi:hypothetical protein